MIMIVDLVILNLWMFSKKTVDPINHTFTITINNCHTNMVGRDWNCIIQNDDMEIVASVEVQTTDQLNKLFDLMNINLSL